MPRLDYVATLRDSVSPGLRDLADSATDLTNILGGVTLSGTGLTQTLSRGIMRLSNNFDELLQSINRLVILRVITAVVAGGFNLLTRAVSLSLQAVSALLSGVSLLIDIFGTVVAGVRQLIQSFGALSGGMRILIAVGGLLTSGLAALDAAFNEGRASATVFGKAIEFVTSTGINLLSNVVPSLTRGIGNALLSEIRPFVERLSGIIGVEVENLNAVILQFALDTREAITQSIDPSTTFALRELSEELESVGQQTERLSNSPRFPRQNAAPIIREMTGTLIELGTQALVPLIQRFQEVAAPAQELFRIFREFTTLSVESVAGSLSILPTVLQSIFTRGGEVVRNGAEVTVTQLLTTLGTARAAAIRGLTTLSGELGEGANMAVNALIGAFSDTTHREGLQDALNNLLAVISQPENFAQLDAGIVNTRVRLAVEIYRDTTAQLTEAAEQRAKQLGLIEETSAERIARINAQATGRQIQSFLQASGQLVRDRQELAIALATLDAGVAIAGAFAHGSRLGPVYLAAYVGTVAANLANTINSIRSLSSPVGGIAPVAPPTQEAEPAARAGPEVSITVIGDNFSAEQLRRTSEEITGALGGQLTA